MAQQRTQISDDKQITLNENERLALQSHLEQWNSCKGGECHAVLNAAVKEARLLAPKMDKDALKRRKYMYKQWFYNNGARKQRIRKHLIKYARKLGIRTGKPAGVSRPTRTRTRHGYVPVDTGTGADICGGHWRAPEEWKEGRDRKNEMEGRMQCTAQVVVVGHEWW
ncbi:uncharacterized protein HD556DRAFT_1312737 [Suillus plorans]|uniref:Uncharacterized protein n=1 Tax=Suillus plorans TaxID=116603 RepID=A0A9P7AFJ7_9AGAM|nr:uncharacterized protein HD556DRAFT_1312737 [Suillus plorans]KAG1787413.1 hypothetical protein HD556DRAFT_1312737 [Suillus plorans]